MNKLNIGKLYIVANNARLEHYWKTERSRTDNVEYTKIILLLDILQCNNDTKKYIFLAEKKVLHCYVMCLDYIKFENQFLELK